MLKNKIFENHAESLSFKDLVCIRTLPSFTLIQIDALPADIFNSETAMSQRSMI